MNQEPLWGAERQRDAGMAQVDMATHESWKMDADIFIETYLRTHPQLFVDDLWAAGLVKPPSPRALGPRVLSAAKRGLMKRSGFYRPSVNSHMTEKPVWTSLVYGVSDGE